MCSACPRASVLTCGIVEGDAEVVSLALTECSPDGRIVAQTVFDIDDTDRALAALDARCEELERG